MATVPPNDLLDTETNSNDRPLYISNGRRILIGGLGVSKEHKYVYFRMP